MKKIFILLSVLIVIVLLLTSCATTTISPKLVDKRMVEAYTEIIPAGYRTSCDFGLDGKYSCGFKYVPRTDTRYHAAQYYFTVNYNGCIMEVSVDRETYESHPVGGFATIEVLQSKVDRCNDEN